ncbi:MAG TPA: hypothetical protein VHE12_07205 [bacterium]|nr:hypothetical protein [bacterium]
MKKHLFPFLSFLLSLALLGSPAWAKAKKTKKKAPPPPKVSAPAPVPTTQATAPVASAETPVPRNHGVPREKLAIAYEYGRKLYAAKRFDQAKDVFKKVALVATDQDLSANSLYLYSQCAFRTEDYNGCVKGLNVLAKRWPASPILKGGFVSRFCSFVIDQVANLQTHWDYYRFKERTDADGNPVWKESVPPGFKIKRINFKLGFGLLRVLKSIDPNSQATLTSKQKLDAMLTRPITMLWVDEKAPPDRWGHPGDFLSLFSKNEKKDFSEVICDRMFFDWKTEKFYLLLNMHDDVRNQKPRFIATTPPLEETTAGAPVTDGATPDLPPPFTLHNLFAIAGYNPYNDSYTNLIESTPADLTL